MRVPDEVIDENGHVNNVAYVQWMQDVAIRHFRALGGEEALGESGATWVARAHRIEYLRPAFAGDALEIATWIADVGRVSSKRCYEFFRAGEEKPLARGETDWVLVDIASGRPKRIPENLHALFKRG
ncbi:MAG: acyl-CoA thioesterase [Akkermansiaceae bacterium]|nr:acyl-CoA thioesterase [Akkermansiaceae bacterium]NNM30570.1 acyl-CoA thioesterase [Akkermansiaceae bacterium]